RYETRSARSKGRLRKVNGLAWCAQAVMAAAEEMVEAATGAAPQRETTTHASGFENDRVAAYLRRNAEGVATASEKASNEALASIATRLRELAAGMDENDSMQLEDLDRILTVLEEQMVDAVRTNASEAELVTIRQQADTELAPFRSKMNAVQLRQV